MKVIFMGTPEFAVPFLESLATKHIITAVFTQRPKPQGRGMETALSPVHQFAHEKQFNVYTPSTLKSEDSFNLIDSIDADVIVVVAYGFILPEKIISNKKHGCINVHPSLLPKYRGAAPMQHTIINGDTETAVCIMQMDAGMDTGDIILQQNIQLTDTITLTELQKKVTGIGSSLLIDTLDAIETLPRIKQSTENLSIASKIKKEHGRINWNKTAFEINCQIRGMTPWPGAFFEYNNTIFKIIKATYTNNSHNHEPGTVIGEFIIACSTGALEILEIQKAGKKSMIIKDFLLGNKIPIGTALNIK